MSDAHSAVKPRLSAMMFLQYAIWGAWLPILFPFLQQHRGFSNEEIGTMFMVGAIGAILAPFLAGQIADRFFATEKYVALSHLVGAVLMWKLADIETYHGFLWFSLAYSLVYCPTMPLTNAIAFHHLSDRDRDFGRVRLWGTIGWIVVGIAVGQWLLHHHTPAGDPPQAALDAAYAAGRADAFRLSAILGAIMGVFSFTLPHTPPMRGAQKNATFEALGEIKYQPLISLFLISVPIACIHQFYFVHTSGFLSAFQSKAATTINSIFGVGGGGLMTIGQMSEIVVLAVIPFVAKRVPRKSILLVGCAAYALRMLVFANVEAWSLPAIPALMFGVALHGVCFGCFIFVAFMIVDEETSPDVRASAQSLYNLVIVGVGIIVGSKLSVVIADYAQGAATELDYKNATQTHDLFMVPMWASLACFVLVLVFYPRQANRMQVAA
ncbi:MAG: MFS transporter [Planctomycetes bacterium]|nr:MFS transporter [Planctomycetota bacterium]